MQRNTHARRNGNDYEANERAQMPGMLGRADPQCARGGRHQKDQSVSAGAVSLGRMVCEMPGMQATDRRSDAKITEPTTEYRMIYLVKRTIHPS